MKFSIFIFFYFIFVLQVSSEEQIEEKLSYKWDKFPEGSYVITETTSKYPEKDEKSFKTKIIKEKSERSLLTMYSSGDNFVTPRPTFSNNALSPIEAGYTMTNTSQGKITIDGVEYITLITKFTSTKGKESKILIIEESKEFKGHIRSFGIPGPDIQLSENVLKCRFEIKSPQITQFNEQVATKVNQKFEASGNSAECIVEKITAKTEREGMTIIGTGEIWSSSSIPGGNVKQILTGQITQDSSKWAGEKIEEKMVVLEFHINKKQ